ILIDAFERRASAGCAIFTHEFRGAASRVPVATTAFGLRRDHVLIEILATFADRSDKFEEEQHQQWAQAAARAFDVVALAVGYPNLLAPSASDRAAKSYGTNAVRLIQVKRRYDPDNVFGSAIPLPIGEARRVQSLRPEAAAAHSRVHSDAITQPHCDG